MGVQFIRRQRIYLMKLDVVHQQKENIFFECLDCRFKIDLVFRIPFE